MSNCQVFRNSNNEIESVKAPNGKESLLFQSILGLQKNKEIALRAWAQVYTPSFKDWFGDWENNKGSKIVDNNGEPMLVYHGSTTGYKLEEFSKNFEKSTKHTDQGFFFSSSTKVASSFIESLIDFLLKL